MKIMTIAGMALALLGSVWVLNADPAGSSQTVISFAGGSVWNADYSGGTCVWYLPVVGDMDLGTLFSDAQKPSKETAYLVWVSEFTVQMLPADPPFSAAPASGQASYAYVLANAGTGTIYYQADPSKRVWPKVAAGMTVTPADLKAMNWGIPVGTFARNASIVRSADGLASDNFIFTAELLHSQAFVLPNGTLFDFSDLIPHGMTCHEYGQQGSSWESGTCVALGR